MLILLCVAITPKQTYVIREQLTFLNDAADDVGDVITGAENSITGAGNTVVKGVSKGVDKIPGEVADAIKDISKLTSDITNLATTLPEKLFKILHLDDSLKNIVSIIQGPGVKILTNHGKIVTHSWEIMEQYIIDSVKFDKVSPTLLVCANRMRYSLHHINNIGTTASLVHFMIKHKRPHFSAKAIQLFYNTIINCINYHKMAARTSFCDLHHTDPPLSEVFDTPLYKDKLSTIVSLLHDSGKQLSKIIGVLADGMDPIINSCTTLKCDPTLIASLRMTKISLELQKKTLQFENMFNKPLPTIKGDWKKKFYTSIINVMYTSTIPPNWTLKMNKNYIDEHIK